jgi:starvation-inducible DNA-binding protein
MSLTNELNARLADGLDLHSQIKVAHWNIKGPLFASLHPLFETFATELATANDDIAERAVTLGGRAVGTVRAVAASSTIADYPRDATRDLDHVRLLLERFDQYVAGLKQTRKRSDELGDVDTSDLLTGIVRAFEKHAWFLRASLEK